MKIIIVDDELSSRENSRNLLNKYFQDIVIIAEADTVESAYMSILSLKPDVVLLDVDLPDGTAFDLLKKFNNITFNLIFITAFEKYALSAIKLSAIDFLLKPFTTEEFIEAIQKAIRKLNETDINLRFNVLMQNFQQQNLVSKLVLRTYDSIHVVPTNEIVRLQGDGSYTTFHIINRKPIVVSKNLKEYELLLECNGFIRTHQSHIVNKKYIICFFKTDGGSLRLSDTTQIPVATRYKEKVLFEISRI